MTVLKADISGSTPLGERLDPEELRAVLGSYFAALAREIHRRGGVVDKYIGDAVIAVFGIPEARADDAARAVVAAVAMQEAIERENIELQRRYGVQLACRIGIATGKVVSGAIAEDVQATYTVVGAPVALAEALESAAALGSVLVSPATRTAAREAIRFAPVEQARPKGSARSVPAHRVLGLRQATRALVNVARATTTSASLQVSSDRTHVLAEERKVVTVLFADISSSEPLGAKLEPARLRTVLGAYFGVLARAIQHYGGTVDKYIGDAVMAVFGAPVSHEDDGVRAVQAALAIQRGAQSLNATLEKTHGIKIAIRIGINTGEVVAGLLPGEVLAYTVTGDAVNTAQRIESATPPHAVLISESTLALTRNAFVTEAVPPLTLKGKSEPVAVYRVLGPERRASPRGGQKIVGRETELARLYAHYREALKGNGQVVHVHGEAGVGKTRLVGELLSGLPKDAARVRARASSYEQATPYALVADLVRRMLAIGPTDDEATARKALGDSPDLAVSGEAGVTLLLELLGYEVRSPLDPAGKRRLIVSLLRDAFKRRTDIGPLVLVIEDLHWRDASSADVIGALSSAVRPMRCLFVSTSREPTDIAWPAEAIALDALPPAAAAELVDRLSPMPLDESTRAMILDRTAGNPFFIEEVVRSLRPGKELVVPTTVQDLLEARLDSLDASPRHVAHGAAVIGRTFATRVLARVTPDDDLEPALGTLEREHFVGRVLAAESTYSFVHALVQEVAYRTQLIAQRRRTHVVVGDAFTELFAERIEEFIDTLAFHYRRGDDDPKARTWLMRAGHRAQRLYANVEALDYFAAAIERSANEAASRVEALEAIGDVRKVVGKYEHALAAYADALAALPDGVVIARARIRRKEAVVRHLQGDVGGAAAVFSEVIEELGEAPGERARALLAMGEIAWRSGHYDEAVVRLEAAIAAAQAANDDDARAEALKHMGTIRHHRGQLEEALAFNRQSLALYEATGDQLGQAALEHNVGVVSRRRSRLDEALAAYERANAIRARIGDQLGLALGLANVAEVHYQRGELAEAYASYARSLEIARTIGWVTGIGMALLGLGATKVELGEREPGRQDILEALREYERAGNRTYMIDALRDLAQSYVDDDPKEALSTAERALALAREAALAQRAGYILQVIGLAHLARGATEPAIVALEESRDLLSRGDERQELARTLAALGRAYSRLPAGDLRRADSRRLLEEARTIFTELSAALDLRRMGPRSG
ncbi:MAG TPA: adenylate/guanylate cyclase domain-containing protein [Candidatus Limnocylindria bacterium]|nr:adenylate/guanylate cyclase domain-containing protein [Candidatus Limnocylindria bacterium]